MKLLLFLLLTPLFGLSQYVDKNGRDLLLSKYTYAIDSMVYHSKLDTFKVIMLVSDTAKTVKLKTYVPVLNDGVITFEYETKKDDSCLWQFGYSVGEFDFWTQKLIIVKYLGSDKKPLPKTVIVWQSQPVK